MDERDFRIACALLDDPLASTAQVARNTGLGDGATRSRLSRLRKDGVIGPTHALPHSDLLGKKYVVALYPGGDWRQFLEYDEVVGSSVNHEGVVAPTCLIEDALPADMVRDHGQPLRTFVQGFDRLSPPGTALSQLQWSILRRLVEQPGAPDRQVADALKLGPKTVANHRRRFLDGNHVRLELQVRSIRGDHVLFHLYVQGPGSQLPEVQQALAKRLEGAWPQQRLDTPRGVLFFCAAMSLADAAAAPKFAMDLSGVEHAELVISLDGAYATPKLVAACDVAERAQASLGGAR